MDNLETIVFIFLVLWALAGTVFMVMAMYWNYCIFRIKAQPEDNNNDQMAVSSALELLSLSRASIELYDDGNDVEGSLYNSPEMINLVREKLNDNPEFRVNCFFNFEEDTLFKEKFNGEKRVKMYFRRDVAQRPENDVHYKIVDTYTAYVSKHPVGAQNRRFKIIDTSQVPKRLREKITDLAFGRYRQKISNFNSLVAQ